MRQYSKPFILRITKAIFIVMILLSFPSVSIAETYISAGGGVFIPDENFGDAWNDRGTDVGVSYLMTNEFAGLELGMHGYTIKTADPFDDDLTAYGIELLVHLQKQHVRLQPFVAVGVNMLKTSMTSPLGDEHEHGTGYIIKAGARLFVTKNLFLGVSLKRFTNNANISGLSTNAGGDAVTVELGIVDF